MAGKIKPIDTSRVYSDTDYRCALTLRRIRGASGKGIADVAEALHMSDATYCRLERGQTAFTVVHVERLAKVFSVSPLEFFA